MAASKKKYKKAPEGPFFLLERDAQKLRINQHYIFGQNEIPANKKICRLFEILSPALFWFKQTLIEELRLEPNEAESETYILCHKIWKNYNPQISSIIPYLKRYVPWCAGARLRAIRKNNRVLKIPIDSTENSYSIDGEFYLKFPELLTEKKFLAKELTLKEKFFIYQVFLEDSPSIRKLAASLNISPKTSEKIIKQIRSKLQCQD